ncbi:AfsR/SARP family transcriptional regulator [Bradyrhizobium elkanii]|uniref:DNA-binding SARP family transcriptional activator n=1 Tax=Bradyrhizobium elkanii TaxID=29448 RepID=A0A8I2C6V3_BRAEL|nr:BTAD domain-containing putative transcriptional regulator [Bradyrhizobium elkanii]MBP1299780.1 DNA-binding SARP family transcriptional activator [Bradyrhizobium elkanii]
MLTVSLLGASRVARGNEQIWLDLGPSGRRLAGFLFTFPDRPHRREKLIDLFWPNLEVARGRRALNSATWRLRKLLSSSPEYKDGDGLRTVGPETILERTPWLDVDTWALLEAAQAALGPAEEHIGGSGMRRLLSVFYRYEGPFLDGEDADWIIEERERLHSFFIQSSMTVVRHLGLCGQHHDAIRLARHALRFDPYREELVRYLLTLLALDERRIEAIKYYEYWIGLIRKELGISPLPATRATIEEIKNLHNAENAQHLRLRFVSRDERPRQPH